MFVLYREKFRFNELNNNKMKKLGCPQCVIHRFFVKNDKGESIVVVVSDDYKIIPIHESDNLEGFDLTILYCLGCSWSGSVKSLTGGKHKKKY